MFLDNGDQSFVPGPYAFVFWSYPFISPVAIGEIVKEYLAVRPFLSDYAWIVTAKIDGVAFFKGYVVVAIIGQRTNFGWAEENRSLNNLTADICVI